MKNPPCVFCEHFRRCTDDSTQIEFAVCLCGKPKILDDEEKSCRKFIFVGEGGVM